MPQVEVGTIVHWWPGGKPPPLGREIMAFVTQRDAHSVTLAILHPNTYNLMVRDGVRFVADPRRKREDEIDNGIWDFTPSQKALNSQRLNSKTPVHGVQ